jgi:O-antigen/teichoic acid export membrane protein
LGGSAGSATARVERPKRRNVMALGTGQLVTWCVTLAWTFIVPRKLGASGWGLLVTGSAIAGILGVLMGQGTGNYLVRQFVRRPQETAPLLGTSLVSRLALIPAAAAVLALYLALTRFGAEGAIIVWIALAVVCFALLGEPYESVFQAVERMEYLALGIAADRVLQGLTAIGLVLLGFGVVSVAVSALGVAAVVFVLKVVWSRRFVRPELHPTWFQARTLARESLPYWAMSLFLTFYVWIDTTMLSLMAPARVVGYYGIATRLFGTLQFAGNMLSTLWLPRLILAHEEGEDQFRHVARVPLGQALVLSLPIAAGGAVVAGPLMRTLFGRGFEGSIPAMALLALCLIPLYLNIIAYAVLVASGRQAAWTKIIVVASAVNPVLNLGAIHFFQSRHHNGATGAALCLLLTEMLISGVSLRVAMRGIVTRASVSQGLRSLVAAGIMALCVYMTRSFGLIPQVLVGGVVFGVMAIVLRVPSEEDMATAKALIRRKLRRGGSGPDVPPPVFPEGFPQEADPVEGKVREPEWRQPGGPTGPEVPPEL